MNYIFLIRNELGISPLREHIIEYRNKLKAYLKGMEHTRIPLQAYNINDPENETLIVQEDDGERHNNIRGRNRRFS
jgi:hypothetical protein